MPATNAAQLQQVHLRTRNGTVRGRIPPGPPPPEERGARAPACWRRANAVLSSCTQIVWGQHS
eukprot:11155367-Lingulodinium_polyedra.AAC.1